MALRDFFKKQILVARVYGIPVRIDYRWFVVFAMSVVLIAANVRKHPLQLGTMSIPPTGDFLAWTLGIVTTLALFVSVFGHELSHALVGRTEGIEIDEIVLHPFGRHCVGYKSAGQMDVHEAVESVKTRYRIDPDYPDHSPPGIGGTGRRTRR